MIAPTAADIGRRVAYVPHWPQDRTEQWPEAVIVDLPEFDDGYATIRFDGEKDDKLAECRDLEWCMS